MITASTCCTGIARGIALVVLLSCSAPNGDRRTSTLDSAAHIAPSSETGRGMADPQANSQFVKFLSLSIATRVQSVGMYDSVYTCPDLENYLQVRWIADGHPLSIRINGDTGLVVAAITTVVSQLPARGGSYLGRIAIREDTGTWRIVRASAPESRWKVCGDEYNSGFGIFRLGNVRSWEPQGASQELAFRIADSIRVARDLPIVR